MAGVRCTLPGSGYVLPTAQGNCTHRPHLVNQFTVHHHHHHCLSARAATCSNMHAAGAQLTGGIWCSSSGSREGRSKQARLGAAASSSRRVGATSASTAAATDAAPGSATGVVRRHIAAVNSRDANALEQLLARDCMVEGLAYSETLRGKARAASFYRQLLGTLPPGLRVVVDDIGGGGGGDRALRRRRGGDDGGGDEDGDDDEAVVGVTWHLELDGMRVPSGRGVSFFRLSLARDGDGDDEWLVTYLRESPEHVAKVPLSSMPMIGLAAPFLRAFSPFLPGGAPPPPTAAAAAAGAGRGTAAATPAASNGSMASSQRPLQNGGALSPSSSSQQQRRRRQQDVPGVAAAAATLTSVASPAAASSPPPAGSPEEVAAAITGAGPGNSQPQARSSSASPSGQALDISGIWIKDPTRSDLAGYERSLDLLQLGGLQKTAALRLFEGLEIEQRQQGGGISGEAAAAAGGGGSLSVRFLTVVPFFKVTELFPLVTVGGSSSGASPATTDDSARAAVATAPTTTMSRRDLKPGSQSGAAAAVPDEVVVLVQWGKPNEGGVVERYTCPSPDVLQLDSTVTVQGRSQSSRQVYRREQRWTPQNRWPGGGA